MATATKSRSPRRSKFRTFTDLQATGIFEKPSNKRGTYATGRNGEARPARNYGLTAAAITELKAAFEGGEKIPNPFNRGFNYFFLEAMKSLGANRNHSTKRVIERFRELASAEKTSNGKTYWSNFKNRESRNKDTGLNWLGRFEQNVEVLQRIEIPGRRNLNPYGQKLLQLGQMVLGTRSDL